MIRPSLSSTLSPYTTLFRSLSAQPPGQAGIAVAVLGHAVADHQDGAGGVRAKQGAGYPVSVSGGQVQGGFAHAGCPVVRCWWWSGAATPVVATNVRDGRVDRPGGSCRGTCPHIRGSRAQSGWWNGFAG